MCEEEVGKSIQDLIVILNGLFEAVQNGTLQLASLQGVTLEQVARPPTKGASESPRKVPLYLFVVCYKLTVSFSYYRMVLKIFHF